FTSLEDSDESLDEDEQTLCRACARLEDDQELSDEDLDDDEAQLGPGYQSDDVWDEDQSQGYGPASRQPERSTGRPTQGDSASRRHTGPDSARRGMSPGRDPQDVKHNYIQMGYDGPPGRGQMAPVRGSERYITATEKRLADQIRYLGAQVDALQEDP